MDYICKYCGKKFEKSSQLGGHIIWCKENPNRSGKSNFNNKKYKNGIRPQNVIRDDLFCHYCGKQYKNTNSLKNHERLCKSNPNRQESPFVKYNKTKRDVWNKGLTKETDERVKQQGETYSSRVKSGIITGVGGYRENAVKGCYKYGYYDGIRCDSSWELAYVVYCKEHNIPIERNTNRFGYFVNNVEYKFVPDFIVNNTTLVEIKGLQDPNWEIKHDTYPNVKFIFKQEIKPYLDYVITKYGKEFYNVLYDNKN